MAPEHLLFINHLLQPKAGFLQTEPAFVQHVVAIIEPQPIK